MYYTVVENRLGFRTLNQKSIVIKLRADQTVEWIKLARIAMENKLFKKLNYRKPWTILALNYPESFESELEPMEKHGIIHRNLKDAGEVLDFVIAFGKTQKEVEELTRAVGPRLGEDAVFWFCYPKQTSKKYTCDFNRDTGWEVMAEFHLEPVRQVAIDEDWSGLRFRHVDKIARITRQESFALTRKGKERSRKK